MILFEALLVLILSPITYRLDMWFNKRDRQRQEKRRLEEEKRG